MSAALRVVDTVAGNSMCSGERNYLFLVNKHSSRFSIGHQLVFDLINQELMLA
jgi:hypothetical protein